MRIQKPADLARVIKTQRQAQSLTQQDVADAVGITRQSLARIERGHGGASFDTVLRIFERLGIRLDATSNGQHQATTQLPRLSNDAFLKALSAAAVPDQNRDPATAATTVLRDIDTSALTAAAAAAAAAARSIDTSALAGAAYRNLDVSPIAAAAATWNIDTSVLLSKWQSSLTALTNRLQENAVQVGTELSARQARRALFSAAIEAGDPDRKDPPTREESDSLENTHEASDG